MILVILNEIRIITVFEPHRTLWKEGNTILKASEKYNRFTMRSIILSFSLIAF